MNEPIFALSTPGLPAAIAVIRISGRGCHELIGQCTAPPIQALAPRALTVSRLNDPRTLETIDEPMIVKFCSPRSFTGEDALELHLHGSPFVVTRVFDILRSLGMREAKPGEFTQRAYLNGKLDLTQAEGLRDLINSQTADQWRTARQLSSGKLREAIDQLRQTVITASAFIEARIDFPDEGETSALDLGPALSSTQTLLDRMHSLLATYDAGKISQHGLRVALIGEPNAGKSTLLNKLVGRDRAIVSEIPGTTRDYIEEACIIDGHLVRLIDTAGIRLTGDRIEQVGIEHSIRIANESDLILWLMPTNQDPAVDSLNQWLGEIDTRKLRRIRTKIDLNPKYQLDEGFDAAISAQSNLGIDALRKLLVARYGELNLSVAESGYITNARHANALRNAIAAVERFFELHRSGAYDEMLAFELQETQRQLLTIIGVVDSDEILGKIFSEFCVGK